MFGRLDNLSVRFRLSAAIVILCVVALVISAISLLTLRNAENWLETIHRETLAEVSSALELSRGAANLATAAPFLLTVQLPFQLQVEADQIVQTIADLEAMAGNDASLALPLARMRAAISNLVRVSSPQSTLQADAQPYLLPGDAPTAADFSVFGQLERIVGDMGDAQIPCSLPELLSQEPLARLRAWHQGMRQRHPIRFKGKRAPP